MGGEYTVALYDNGDYSQVHPARVVHILDHLPQVGHNLTVPFHNSVYGGIWSDMINGRIVRIVCEATHRERHIYATRTAIEVHGHYYVRIANEDEREALERLRRLYSDLGGVLGMNILFFIDTTLYPKHNGRVLIEELVGALNAAGFPPRTILEWYRISGTVQPAWLDDYLK